MSRYTVLLGLLVAMVAVCSGDEVHCGDNEKWNICGRTCQPSCQNPKPNPKWCPGIVCHNYTTGGCRCDDGYVRDTTGGSCVLPADCQNNEG